MIHLWSTEGTGRYPICGEEGVRKGEPTLSVYFRDLCRNCLAYQERKSAIVRRQQRKRKKQNGEA